LKAAPGLQDDRRGAERHLRAAATGGARHRLDRRRRPDVRHGGADPAGVRAWPPGRAGLLLAGAPAAALGERCRYGRRCGLDALPRPAGTERARHPSRWRRHVHGC